MKLTLALGQVPSPMVREVHHLWNYQIVQPFCLRSKLKSLDGNVVLLGVAM